jgi:hypothetical protein
MTELDVELHNLRVLGISLAARRQGLRPSEKRVSDLLQSGVSLEAALQCLLRDQGFFTRWIGKLRRWLRR